MHQQRKLDREHTYQLTVNQKRLGAGLSPIKVTADYIVTHDTLIKAAVINKDHVVLCCNVSNDIRNDVIQRVIDILNYPPFRATPTEYLQRYCNVYSSDDIVYIILMDIRKKNIIQFTTEIQSDSLPLTGIPVRDACILDILNKRDTSKYLLQDRQHAETHINNTIKSNSVPFSL